MARATIRARERNRCTSAEVKAPANSVAFGAARNKIAPTRCPIVSPSGDSTKRPLAPCTGVRSHQPQRGLPMKPLLVSVVLVLLSAAAAGAADLAKTSDRTAWLVHNRALEFLEDGGMKFVRLDARSNDGVAWLAGSDFADGTIEIELRGKNAVGQSFVGIAFHGAGDTTYDAVYFRPFNFKIADPARRARAVQYISHPTFTWEKLRADHPGTYEQPVSPAPDPDGWFKARIVIDGRKVSVFVDDATTPTLTVTTLSERRGGRVGLWVGNGSSGDFANLKLTPKQG